ncbi:hypothetical protein [Pontibacter pamirensis]|uniref:hypothetical protein n=1 Tax=Pontibacter pamirensis TaxID=2562824 RepID=UPI0013893D57|nr:hypothetical protein [Pontibacter pamirensis]
METLAAQATLEQPEKSMSTLFPCGQSVNGTFDVGPLLAAIDGQRTAQQLDDSITYLTEYFVTEGTYNGPYYANLLCSLRLMRNAILKGGGFIDFDKV